MTTATAQWGAHPQYELATQCYEVKEDIRLVVQKGTAEAREVCFDSQGNEYVEIGFNLGGAIRCTVHAQDGGLDGGSGGGRDGASRLLHAKHGQVCVGFYPGCSGVLEYPEDGSVCWVGIYLPVGMFPAFFDVPVQAWGAQHASRGGGGMVYHLVGPISAGMMVALHQILRCPYLGKTKCLFLESKVLELISHVRLYSDCSTDGAGQRIDVRLAADDEGKMWQAKAILDERLEEPPSIVELAKLVGVNEFKLKKGFRQVHGLTPYKYLSEQRLERARRLLCEREMNVTEAAFAVGYSSLSHFAKIFRERYGVNPHEYMAQAVT